MESKTIVITRSQTDNKPLQANLERLGYRVIAYPCVQTSATILDREQRQILRQIASYDWILFTSKKGVHFFLRAIQELGVDRKTISAVKIGAVGPITAAEAEKHGLRVTYIPQRFTTQELGRTLQDVAGKSILMPRADIANRNLQVQLERKGAMVINIPIYHTSLPKSDENQFKLLLQKKERFSILFASPSAVNGFMKKNGHSAMRKQILQMQVLSIGPVTSQSARNYGFTHIRTADTHTIKGILSLLKNGDI